MKPTVFNIEIGELVLHDFEGIDGAEVGAALRAELGRLLAAGPWPGGAIETTRIAELASGGFELPAGADAAGIGHSLARRIHQGMLGSTADAGQQQTVAGEAHRPMTDQSQGNQRQTAQRSDS